MKQPYIETPRGRIFLNAGGNAELKWNPLMQPRWQARFSRVQRFVDSEILRLVEPYVPLLTGMLVMSGILGTEIGSGFIKWITPYARAQYYSPRPFGSQTGALRGPFWFHRGKAVWGEPLVASAKLMMRENA